MRGRGALCLAVLLVGASVSALATAGLQDAAVRVERAAKFITEKRYADAARELQQALADEPEFWEAHYQMGRMLGLRGDMEGALPWLLESVELHPGFAHGHELAAIAAWEAGERQTAWDQIILAFHAGADVAARIRTMAAVESPPEDFQERISAPRVLIAPLDLEEISWGSEIPFDRNPLSRDDPSRSGVPDEVRGRELTMEVAADLQRVRRQFAASLARSTSWGVVLDPSLSEYVLRISVQRLDDEPPRSMRGTLELVASQSGETGYRRAFDLRAIGSSGELLGQIEVLVDHLEAWLRQLRERQPQ